MKTLTARRKGDLIVSIVQNNDDKMLSISDANNALLSLLSYSHSELEGQCFFKILASSDETKITELLEYEDYGIDVENILARTRQLHLKTKYGAIIPVKIKVFPSSSISSSESRCEILAREYSCADYFTDFRRENGDCEHEMDNVLRIMNYQSTGREFALLSRFCQQHKQSCIAGLLELSDTSKGTMRSVVESLKKSIRKTDQIGILGKVLVVFVIGCSTELAERPISRIIGNARKIDKDATISYFNLLEHPILDLKADLLQQKRIFGQKM